MGIKFSDANIKIKSLGTVKSLQPYLTDKRKIYSFDLLSGHSCPYALACKSKVVEDSNGKRTIEDGAETKFRCFSASQEVIFSAVYDRRKNNFEIMKKADHQVILDNIPNDLGICRIHVGGDFFSQKYFDSWIKVAEIKKDSLFYAYTKSLPFVIRRIDKMPPNFVITASYGGKHDDLIEKHNLKSAIVVYHPDEAAALNLEIDHDDSHAADPTIGSFALLIHAQQPKGSEASKAIKRLKEEGIKFSYGKKD